MILQQIVIPFYFIYKKNMERSRGIHAKGSWGSTLKPIGNEGSSPTPYKPLLGFSTFQCGTFYLHILTSPRTCGEFSSLTRGQHILGDVEHVWPLGFHTWANPLWYHEGSWGSTPKSIGNGESSPTPYKPLLGFSTFQCGTFVPSHSHTPPHVWRIFKPNTWTTYIGWRGAPMAVGLSHMG